MKYFVIYILLISVIYGSDSYLNSKLRNPIGSYSLSIGGISVLTDAENYFNNPSIITKSKKIGLSVSKYPLNREEVTLNFSSKIKNKLGFNITYLYRGEKDIPIYNSNEEIEKSENDLAHFLNLGFNYILYNSKKIGDISIGSGILLSKEYLPQNIETKNPINGISLGINYKKNNLEIGASLLNILWRKEWINIYEKNSQTEKEVKTVEIPLKGLIGAKYKIFDKYSLLFQTDLENTTVDRYKAIIRGGLIIDLLPIQIYTGYGDERYSIGLGYKKRFDKKILGIHTAIAKEKEEGFLLSFSSNFEFQ